MPKSKEIKNKNTLSMLSIQSLFSYFNNHIQALNSSKLFAGLMIIILNIASKFVNIKVGKTLEAYLKYTFSRQILGFAIAWMGTRDIYIAFFSDNLLCDYHRLPFTRRQSLFYINT